jgi:hypothetical protein
MPWTSRGGPDPDPNLIGLNRSAKDGAGLRDHVVEINRACQSGNESVYLPLGVIAGSVETAVHQRLEPTA